MPPFWSNMERVFGLFLLGALPSGCFALSGSNCCLAFGLSLAFRLRARFGLLELQSAKHPMTVGVGLAPAIVFAGNSRAPIPLAPQDMFDASGVRYLILSKKSTALAKFLTGSPKYQGSFLCAGVFD